MADNRTLTAQIILDGDKIVKEKLTEIERRGNQVVKSISVNGQLVSKTITTTAGQSATSMKLSFIAAAQGVSLFMQTAGPAIKALGEMAQAARDDETSISRRNAALEKYGEITPDYIDSLEEQVRSYQKLYGISDEYTREVQTQFIALGANKDQITKLTDASIALAEITGGDASTNAKQLTRFMEGLSDTVRGTTIHVDKDATAQERLQAIMEGTASGVDILTDKMETGQGAQDRWTEAMGEFKEGIGAFFNTEYAVDQLNKLTDALNSLTDWITVHGKEIETFGRFLNRFMLSMGTAGISEIGNKYNDVRNFVNRNKYGVTGGIPGPAIQVKSLDPQAFPDYTVATDGDTSGGDVELTTRQKLRKAFGQEGLANILGNVAGGGGVKGGIQTALTMGLSAVNPILGVVGGGILGKIFGGGGHKDSHKGMTPGNPIYTEAKISNVDELARAANVSRSLMIGGASSNVNWAMTQLAYSAAGGQ